MRGIGVNVHRRVAPGRPLFFDNLLIELDAADRTTQTLSGSSVTQWNNKGTSGGAVTGSIPYPVKGEGPERIVFSGTAADDLLGDATIRNAGNDITDVYAISALVRINDPNVDHAILEVGVGPYRRGTLQFGQADKTFALIYQKSSGGPIEYIFTPPNQIPVTPAWRLITFSFDFNFGDGDAWTNRTQVTNGSAPTGASVADTFNSFRVGGPGFGDMAFDLAWFGVFQQHLVTADVGQIAEYLEHRFAIPIR